MFVYIWFLRRHNDISRCVRSGFPRRLWKRKSFLSFHKPLLRMAGEGWEEVEGKQQREKKVAGIWRAVGCSTLSNCLAHCSTSTPSCSSSPTACPAAFTLRGDLFTSGLCSEPPPPTMLAPQQGQPGLCKGEPDHRLSILGSTHPQAPSCISLHSVIFTVSKPSSQTTSCPLTSPHTPETQWQMDPASNLPHSHQQRPPKSQA